MSGDRDEAFDDYEVEQAYGARQMEQEAKDALAIAIKYG